MAIIIAMALVFCAAVSDVDSESVHWQYRDLVCDTADGVGVDFKSKDPANCHVVLKETANDPAGRPAQANQGCFDEVVNDTQRTYCNLLCPGADTVYLIKRTPQTHRSCFVFYTHRLERRGDDWFLWREKACRNSRITFLIRCEFLFPRKNFITDEEVFAKIA